MLSIKLIFTKNGGRSQVVRQWIVTPLFAGSNPVVRLLKDPSLKGFQMVLYIILNGAYCTFKNLFIFWYNYQKNVFYSIVQQYSKFYKAEFYVSHKFWVFMLRILYNAPYFVMLRIVANVLLLYYVCFAIQQNMRSLHVAYATCVASCINLVLCYAKPAWGHPPPVCKHNKFGVVSCEACINLVLCSA